MTEQSRLTDAEKIRIAILLVFETLAIAFFYISLGLGSIFGNYLWVVRLSVNTLILAIY